MHKRIAFLLLFSTSAFSHHTLNHSFDENLNSINTNAAKDILDQALLKNSKLEDDYEFVWRMSRIYTIYGDQLKDNDQKKEAYEKAYDYAKKAIRLKPDHRVGYVRRASAAGKLALLKGPFSAVNLVTELKADAEKAIKLNHDPEVRNLAVAHYILGRAHVRLLEKSAFVRSLIGFGWANLEDGLKNFKKAIELDPTFIMFHLDYAKALIENNPSPESLKTAKEELQKILTLKQQEYGDKERIEEAQALLKSSVFTS